MNTLTKLVRNPNADSLAIIGAAAIIGIVILTAMHLAVPDYLSLIAITAVGALAGVALPAGATPAADVETIATNIAGKITNRLGLDTPAAPAAPTDTAPAPTVAPIPGTTP